MPSPVIFTPLPRVQCRQAGLSRRWASPPACAAAMARAASDSSDTARGASSGPSASMSSSDSPTTHSITT